MDNRKYLRNKDRLIKDIKEFDETNNMLVLADVYLDIKKILTDECFPIIKYSKVWEKKKNVKKKQSSK